MSLSLGAFIWGCICAVSLPLGAIAGLTLKHVEKAQRRDAKRMIRALSNVRVSRQDEGKETTIAELGVGETFSEIALFSEQLRTATVQAIDGVEAWTILHSDFAALLERSPELQRAVEAMVATRLQEMHKRDASSEHEADEWAQQARRHFRQIALPLTEDDYQRQIEKHSGSGAALAIWLGIALDAIPESLVIGLLVVASAAAGESMKVAFIAVIFPANPAGTMQLAIMLIEGIAAGAMLTMIAETMLPEAFQRGGGSTVGFSTLAGFLASLGVKLGGS